MSISLSQKCFLTLLQVCLNVFAIQLPSHAGSEWGVCRLNEEKEVSCQIEHYNTGVNIVFSNNYMIRLKDTDYGLIRIEDGRACQRKVASTGYIFTCRFKSDSAKQTDIIEIILKEPPRYNFQ